MPLISQIFPFIAIIYAVAQKCRRREWNEAAILSLGGGIALYNSLFMYGFFTGQIVSPSLRCIQQVVSCMIVPIAYTYFSKQMGRSWLNNVSITLWCMTLLLFIPSGFYTLDGVPPIISTTEITPPMMIYFFLKGKEVFNMHTADIIILIQALFTLCRLVVLTSILRQYHLRISPHLRSFLLWCGGAIAFIIFTSIHNTQQFSQPQLLWTYYILYAILITSIFILIAQNFNLHLIMLGMNKNNDNSKDQEIEDVDKFIIRSQAQAEQLREMIDRGFYRKADVCVDDVAHELGTNRTYLCRMLKAEFNTTFTELVTTYRMSYAEHLLRDTDMSITDIALQSGFSDEHYFARRFKKIHGISPSEYRKNTST